MPHKGSSPSIWPCGHGIIRVRGDKTDFQDYLDRDYAAMKGKLPMASCILGDSLIILSNEFNQLTL